MKESSVHSSPQVYWDAVKTDFLKRIGQDKELKLRKAAEDLGIIGLTSDGKGLRDAILCLDGQRKQANLLAIGLKNQLGSWQNVAVFLLVCLGGAAGLAGLRELLTWATGWRGLTEVWSPAVITASSIATAITSVIAIAGSKVRGAIEVLQTFRRSFDEAAGEALKSETEKLRSIGEELAKLKAAVAEGQARLAESTEKLGEAAREYNDGTGKGRLLKFVRSRAANKDYARHLGLVATIRKDFEELSDLVAVTASAADKNSSEIERERTAFAERVQDLIKSTQDGERPLFSDEECRKLKASAELPTKDEVTAFNRIVLYIDDLDRCQPEKVAEVL